MRKLNNQNNFLKIFADMKIQILTAFLKLLRVYNFNCFLKFRTFSSSNGFLIFKKAKEQQRTYLSKKIAMLEKFQEGGKLIFKGHF